MQEILDYLYFCEIRVRALGLKNGITPRQTRSRSFFPVIHVAGTNGKGSTCAMLIQFIRQMATK